MRHTEFTKFIRGFMVVVVTAMLFLVAPHSYAVCDPDFQTCSSSYGVSESFFGTGGLDTCPTQGGNAYCANMSAGELTVGNTQGTAFQAQAGFNTNRTEYLEVNVTKSAVDLGVIDPSSTGADTATFNVKSYPASGYVVQIYGTTPTYGGHAITAMAGAASSVGTEQFGLNLVANTSPTVGADVTQDVDAQNPSLPFGFGAAATNYDTADTFRYSSGDTIASSTESSGYTYYTISYMMNVTNVTPAGTYIANQSVVVTSTF